MRMIVWLFVGSFLIGAACPASANDLSPENLLIVLDRDLHFTSQEGADLTVTADQYSVEPPSESGSVITLRKGTATITLPAIKISHNEQLAHPSALLISDRSDNMHIVVVLPGGVAYDTVGYFDAVHPRDPNVMGATQIQSALYRQATLAEIQRRMAAQQQAKAELEPAALLARIKVLEYILACMSVES